MIKCPNKNLPEWKLLEKSVPDMCYTIWDLNNGNGIEKAPSGEPSILYKDLVDFYQNEDLATKCKSLTFTSEFTSKYGEWFNTENEPQFNDFRNTEIFNRFNANTVINTDAQAVVEDQTEGYQRIEPVIRTLRNAFPGLDVLVVSDEKYAQMASKDGVDASSNAYNLGNKVVMRENATTEVAAEEMLHPFVATLFADNNVLFDLLYNEASDTFKSLKSNVNSLYGHLSDDIQRQEVVTKALAKMFAENKTEQGLKAKLLDLLKLFVGWLLSTLFHPILQRSTQAELNVQSMSKMSLSDIAKLLRQDDTQILIKYNETPMYNYSASDDILSKIVNGMQLRLWAIEHKQSYSGKLVDVNRVKLLQKDLQDAEIASGIVSFVEHVEDTIPDVVNFVDEKGSAMTETELNQLNKTYIGVYAPLLTKVYAAVTDPTQDFDKNIKDFELFKQTINVLLNNMHRINHKLEAVTFKKADEALVQHAESVGSDRVLELRKWLAEPNHDISSFALYIGIASNSSSQVVQVVENMIRNAKNQRGRRVYDKCRPVVMLIKKAYDSIRGSKPSMREFNQWFLELDSDGVPTGNLVRRLNVGQLAKDRLAYQDKLAAKFNLKKNDNGKWILPEDDKTRYEYDEKMNAWDDKHAERRYTKEYYTARNKMSAKAKAALGDISSQILMVLAPYIVDGVLYNHEMSDADKRAWNNLRIQKTRLSNEYNEDGSAKTGDDLQIALDIQKFKEATAGKLKYKTNQLLFDEVSARMRNKLTPELYALWHAANVHDEISEEFYNMLGKRDLSYRSQEYQDLVKKRRKILALYRKQNTFEVDYKIIPDDVKRQIKEMDSTIAAMDHDYAKKGSPGKPSGKVYDKDLDREFKVITTDAYHQLARMAKGAGELIFKNWYNANHYMLNGKMRPISIWTTVMPTNENYILKGVPNNEFSEIAGESEFFNKNYTNEYGFLKPRSEIYDNSAAYDRVLSGEVGTLYNMLVDLMLDSYDNMPFVSQKTVYKLPQITSRILQQLSRNSQVFKNIKHAISDSFVVHNDDVDFNEPIGVLPDGTPNKIVPTHYMRRIEDMHFLTTDLFGSIFAFYDMAVNYNEMSAIADKMEIINNRIRKTLVKGGTGVSNISEKINDLMDINIYGYKFRKVSIPLGSKGRVDVGKPLNALHDLMTKINLTGNIPAMITGFLTGEYNAALEAKLGKYFNNKDLGFASRIMGKNVLSVAQHIGDPFHENKVLSLLQRNQLAITNEEALRDLDRKSIVRAANQHLYFGGYSAGDFMFKGQVLLSIYNNFRLTKDGKFMMLTDFLDKYYPNDRENGKKAFYDLLVSLYDAYGEDGKPLDKYKDIIDTKLENLVSSKALVVASRIDGNITETDKARLHVHAVLRHLTMHKNWLPVGMQERWKRSQFNMNTGVAEQGYYVTTYNTVVDMFKAAVAQKSMSDAYAAIAKTAKNLSQEERYGLRKVATEAGNLALIYIFLVPALIGMLRSTEDDDWGKLIMGYSALRTTSELAAFYNPYELVRVVENPVAGVNTIDTATNIISGLLMVNYFDSNEDFGLARVHTGAYKNDSKLFRDFMKMTPMKNTYELMKPKARIDYVIQTMEHR